jgi:4-alpha-glucanotransferase
MIASRASGIILHPTSLPGPFGIGDLGPEAYIFFYDTNQSFWQMLSLGPIGYGNSPYMCFSAFAGNPLLISPEKLVDEGLLDGKDLQKLPFFREDRVDYRAAENYKNFILNRAFQNSRHVTASHDHNTTVGWFTAEPGTQTTQSPEEIRMKGHAFWIIWVRTGEKSTGTLSASRWVLLLTWLFSLFKICWAWIHHRV